MRQQNNEYGQMLVEMLIAIALLGICVLMVAPIYAQARSTQKLKVTRMNLHSISQNLFTVLTNPSDWNATATHPSNNGPGASFKCVHDGSAPCPPAETAFKVYNAKGELYIDGNAADAGFRSDVTPCVPGAVDCLYKINLSWIPICLTCTPRQIQVVGRITYFSPTQKSLQTKDALSLVLEVP